MQLSGTVSKASLLDEYTVESVEMEDTTDPDNGSGSVVLRNGDNICKMMVTFKNGKKEGKAVILRENNTLFMELSFTNNVANGQFLVYDEMGILIERGDLKNGKRNGVFRTFSKDGDVVNEVRYRDGVPIGSLKNSKMEGFFEETDEKGEITAIAQFCSNLIDKNGVCYEFEEGKVKRKCLYKEGVMSQVIMEVNGDTMTEYNSNGKRVYEGGFVFDEEKGLLKNGKGTEYTKDSALYVGFFLRGERNGDGTLFDGFSPVYIGGWKNGKRCGRGKEMDKNRKVLRDGMWDDDEFVTDAMIERIGLRVDSTEYVVKKKSYNDTEIKSLFIPITLKLKRIVIGDMCFRNVSRFVLDGLSDLESVKVGKKSFTLGKGKTIKVQVDSQCSLLNCPKLREFEVGDESFSNCINFQVKNLPSLETLRVGDWCYFFESAFELRSRT